MYARVEDDDYQKRKKRKTFNHISQHIIKRKENKPSQGQ
jgi:hypothetical protein